MRPSLVGKTISSIVAVLVYVVSAVTLAGLLFFNQNDVGLAQAVRDIWQKFGNAPKCEHDMDPKNKCCKKCGYGYVAKKK